MEKKAPRTNGSLKISNDVIVKIAELAATEIIGVATEGEHLVLPEMPVAIASRFVSPVRVNMTGESAEISVSIVAIQGHKAINVAGAVQQSVKSAVQNMTGIAVSKVNVKIVGIKTKKED